VTASTPLHARRVMIVDDHQELRALISRLVRSWGHEVAVAVDGPSAISLAEAFRPECAIVDLSMPEMNGIELAACLRERFPPADLFLIALSGYADADLPEACLTAGFDAYLVKPANIPQLEQLLGGPRQGSDASER
jgi:CheY-like chemotaxis protein